MATTKEPNYTDEMVKIIVDAYQEMIAEGGAEYANANIADIAQLVNRPVKSVIAKLARSTVNGVPVYQKVEKPVRAKKKEGFSKKELLSIMEHQLGIDPSGFEGATIAALTRLVTDPRIIDAAEAAADAATEAESDEMSEAA